MLQHMGSRACSRFSKQIFAAALPHGCARAHRLVTKYEGTLKVCKAGLARSARQTAHSPSAAFCNTAMSVLRGIHGDVYAESRPRNVRKPDCNLRIFYLSSLLYVSIHSYAFIMTHDLKLHVTQMHQMHHPFRNSVPATTDLAHLRRCHKLSTRLYLADQMQSCMHC